MWGALKNSSIKNKTMSASMFPKDTLFSGNYLLYIFTLWCFSSRFQEVFVWSFITPAGAVAGSKAPMKVCNLSWILKTCHKRIILLSFVHPFRSLCGKYFAIVLFDILFGLCNSKCFGRKRKLFLFRMK